ncbi:FHA domain-containing protein [Geitlerinema splendidum]|jgi:pSer/pThr/pTyr-binding forkhead associated (FHA) protein|nr:FHA domain-containing protein [Geitlerinema splendidum]
MHLKFRCCRKRVRSNRPSSAIDLQSLCRLIIMFAMNRYFELHTAENRLVCRLSPTPEDGYVVGRSDEMSEFVPDIDLAGFMGRELGVSRRHLALTLFRLELHIIDLNSVNGTYLNGKRLPGEIPTPVNDGDEIRLGSLALKLTERSP